jgi:hypothetical protein
MDDLTHWRLKYMRDMMTGIMEREICGSYRFVPERSLPVVCVLLPDHAGSHTFTSYTWDD